MMNLLPMYACSTRNLMVGKNVLWVAKQHGHSIVTMLRIYAAWTEGAVEADVEAIKRSMNHTSIRRGSLRNLAVDLSVAEGTRGPNAFAFAVTGVPVLTLTYCFTAEKERQPFTQKVAGVAGFEPTNGGIKTHQFPIAATRPATRCCESVLRPGRPDKRSRTIQLSNARSGPAW